MLYSPSSLTWKCPRGISQFSHLFIGWKGPCDDKNHGLPWELVETKWLTNTVTDKHRGLQLAFRSFDHAVIFGRRPQSRRKIEPNVKEENEGDAWKYHFKWRNSREKLERKVKTGMMDVAIQCLTKIFSLRNYLQAQKNYSTWFFSVLV